MPLINTGAKRIVLASQSPRRIELLKKVISDFEIQVSNVDENSNSSDPISFVLKISQKKAEKVAQNIDSGVVIGADSIVVLDHKILGKPLDNEDAISMLKFLSGNEHRVYTGFTIIDKPSNQIISDYEMTKVTFRSLEMWEIEQYVKVAQPYDKAGAYGIQDESAVFVEKIEGCYYNVMGLPLTKLFKLLLPFLKL